MANLTIDVLVRSVHRLLPLSVDNCLSTRSLPPPLDRNLAGILVGILCVPLPFAVQYNLLARRLDLE